MVFRDAAAGLLFAGDHVLPRITPSIGFEAAPAPSPLAPSASTPPRWARRAKAPIPRSTTA